MIRIRPAADRGHTRIDWLDSRHTFSFGEYHDPAHMGFRSLRVLNDDRVAPASGFGSHPHRDMEIVSLVLAGALEHRDSIGTGSIIRPGEIQRMSAGSGIVHSEWNPSPTEPVHFLQIWLVPRMRGRAPAYEQTVLPATRGAFHVIASPDAAAGGVTIDADAAIHRAVLDAGTTAAISTRRAGGAWVHVARGDVTMVESGIADPDGAADLHEGDGASVERPGELRFTASDDAEILVFDLG